MLAGTRTWARASNSISPDIGALVRLVISSSTLTPLAARSWEISRTMPGPIEPDQLQVHASGRRRRDRRRRAPLGDHLEAARIRAPPARPAPPEPCRAAARRAGCPRTSPPGATCGSPASCRRARRSRRPPARRRPGRSGPSNVSTRSVMGAKDTPPRLARRPDRLCPHPGPLPQAGEGGGLTVLRFPVYYVRARRADASTRCRPQVPARVAVRLPGQCASMLLARQSATAV